uniref:RAB6A-GEF complex partner protein 2 n=1 Tax=Globodera rostochiensis TaxID=31243 RepID=A0A914GX30_GLORO
MSIEVKVSLSRKSAVFLTGENFTVQISLTNGDSEQARSLAWGCVQLHCEGNVSTAQKATDRRHNRSSSSAASSTAVTRAKQAIFSSEPAILFCDIRLAPGAVQNFETQKEIPLDLPPSFKGHFAKYFWYISVATQQVDAPIKMVQLPIKVLSVGIDVSAVKQSEPTGNPFLGNDFKSPSVVEIAVSRIEEVCSIRKQRFYEIKSGGRLIAAVVIFRNVFKLGDDVVGRFEFPQEEVQCLQALVRAEVVETNLMDDNGNREEASSSAQSVHVFSTEHMVTAFVRETHFKLQLPMNAVPSFTTESVKVRWRLRFEFVITPQKVMEQKSDRLQTLADDLDIETMKWDLPISVLTCNPFNAGLSTLQPSTTSFGI